MLSSLHVLPLLLPVWPLVLAIPGFYLKLFYEFDPFCLGAVQLAPGRSVFPPACVCSMCTLCQGASLQLQETQVTQERPVLLCSEEQDPIQNTKIQWCFLSTTTEKPLYWKLKIKCQRHTNFCRNCWSTARKSRTLRWWLGKNVSFSEY